MTLAAELFQLPTFAYLGSLLLILAHYCLPLLTIADLSLQLLTFLPRSVVFCRPTYQVALPPLATQTLPISAVFERSWLVLAFSLRAMTSSIMSK